MALATFAEQVGYDLVTFQDHPYLPNFLDTWTLLSYVAARTERITLSPNVLNLPLRQPAVIARSAASLDLLTGGRVELGLGAGAFWEAHRGERRPTPLAGPRGGRPRGGDPRHPGRSGPRTPRVGSASRVTTTGSSAPSEVRRPPMTSASGWGRTSRGCSRLVGRMADGWLPSLGYLKGGPADLDELNEVIDEAAGAGGAGADGHPAAPQHRDRPRDRADRSDRARARDVDVHPRVGRTHCAAAIHGGSRPRGPRARRRRPRGRRVRRTGQRAARSAASRRRSTGPSRAGRDRDGRRRGTPVRTRRWDESTRPVAPPPQPTTSTTNGRRTSASTSSTSTITSARSSRPSVASSSRSRQAPSLSPTRGRPSTR